MSTTPLGTHDRIEDLVPLLREIGAMIPDVPPDLNPQLDLEEPLCPIAEERVRDLRDLYTPLPPFVSGPEDRWPPVWHPEVWQEGRSDLEEGDGLGNGQDLVPGTDLVAWYRGYHLEHPGYWGIYVRERAVLEMGIRLYRRVERAGGHLSLRECRDLYLDKVLWHEYFHHMVEAAVTRLEVKHRVPLYPLTRQAARRIRRSRGFSVQEMCANAFALDKVTVQPFGMNRFSRGTQGLTALMEMMRRQPLGYNAFENALHPVQRVVAYQSLAREVLPQREELHEDFIFNLVAEWKGKGRLYQRDVPHFLVDRL